MLQGAPCYLQEHWCFSITSHKTSPAVRGVRARPQTPPHSPPYVTTQQLHHPGSAPDAWVAHPATPSPNLHNCHILLPSDSLTFLMWPKDHNLKSLEPNKG